MKHFSVMLAALLALGVAGAGMAADEDQYVAQFDVDDDSPVLPVLVAVDAEGKVTRVEPAVRLRSGQQQQLNQMVREMIKAPARDKQGNAIASQFVMRFGMENVQGGDAAARLVYMSATNVPVGPLHWVNTGGTSSRAEYALSFQGVDEGNHLQTDTDTQAGQYSGLKPSGHSTSGSDGKGGSGGQR